MPIRYATLNDLPDLLAVGEQMHRITRFKDQPLDRERLMQNFAGIITQGKGRYAFLVATNTCDRVVGGLLGVMEQHIFNVDWSASVMYYAVLPQERGAGHAVRLLKAFEQWARNREAVEVSLCSNAGVDMERLGQFVKRMGFSQMGGSYVMALDGAHDMT